MLQCLMICELEPVSGLALQKRTRASGRKKNSADATRGDAKWERSRVMG